MPLPILKSKFTAEDAEDTEENEKPGLKINSYPGGYCNGV